MKFLREPLLHFLVLGGALFAVNAWRASPDPQQAPKASAVSHRLELSAATVNGLIENWQKTRFRSPTDAELNGLIDSRVQQEILYREALSFGLDKDDTIIRRRLAQKMEFLAEGLIDQGEPSQAQLQAYLDSHPVSFQVPPSIRFQQIYFSPAQHQQSLAVDMRSAMTALDNNPGIDPATLGDRLLTELPRESMTEQQLASRFGPQFAAEFFSTEQGRWQGPLRSALGMHLVKIEQRDLARVPALTEVADRVREALLRERRLGAAKTYYQAVRDKYQVVVEPPAAPLAVIQSVTVEDQ
ncbi:MAG: peptidyl-prolyl cis-trans isomerase [Motiliproteus sp.]